jgi:hypothetical protein
MTTMYTRFPRRLAALAALALLPLAAGCDGDPNEPEIAERLALTVNSVENSLSLVPVDGGDDVQARTVGLGAQGTPVGVAARGAYAVVPLGTYPFAAVVNLRDGTLASTVPLPDGSGATGQAFVNDTLAVVANPGRNSVTPIRVRRGQAGLEVAAGTYPQAIVSDEARVYVLNGNLVNFAPAGPGSITVLDNQMRFVKTVQLTGINPSAGAIVGNRLYVLNAGNFGGSNGSLSVVNLQTLTEEARHDGFGDYPSSIAASPNGELYIGIYGTGVVVWSPATSAFRIGLDDALTPGGFATVSGIGFDYAGRWHTTDPRNCINPGFMFRVNAGDGFERGVAVGVCPFGLAFADVPEEDEDD